MSLVLSTISLHEFNYFFLTFRLVVQKKLVKDSEEEMMLVRKGFEEIVLPDTLLLLTAQEICLALSGNQDIDIQEVQFNALHFCMYL